MSWSVMEVKSLVGDTSFAFKPINSRSWHSVRLHECTLANVEASISEHERPGFVVDKIHIES